MRKADGLVILGMKATKEALGLGKNKSLLTMSDEELETRILMLKTLEAKMTPDGWSFAGYHRAAALKMLRDAEWQLKFNRSLEEPATDSPRPEITVKVTKPQADAVDHDFGGSIFSDGEAMRDNLSHHRNGMDDEAKGRHQ